jgi:hypothetical protein
MHSALLRMGMTDRWARYRGGGYTDSHQVGPYKVEIADEGDDTRILLWNPVRPCVTMVIEKKRREAVVDVVKYDPDCTSPEKMKRGSGTRAMIDFSLDLLRQQGVKIVQLSDASTIPCNGININLELMYFLKYGQTWYEKYFGFHPTLKYIAEYEKLKQRRLELDTDFLGKQPCEYFTDDVLQEALLKIGYNFLRNIVWEREL